MRWRRAIGAVARFTGRLTLILLWAAAIISLIVSFGLILVATIPYVPEPGPPLEPRTTFLPPRTSTFLPP